jgi:hypothetical protein
LELIEHTSSYLANLPIQHKLSKDCFVQSMTESDVFHSLFCWGVFANGMLRSCTLKWRADIKDEIAHGRINTERLPADRAGASRFGDLD